MCLPILQMPDWFENEERILDEQVEKLLEFYNKYSEKTTDIDRKQLVL